MKRAVLAIVSTITGLVMVLNYRVPASEPIIESEPASDTAESLPPVDETTSTTTTTTPVVEGPTTAPTTTTTAPRTTTTTTTPARVVTGPSVDTEYGPFQVRVTRQGAKLLSVKTIEYPQDTPTSAKLNKQTVVKLEAEAMRAQSADIDIVSGATEASNGFIASLRGALAK